MTKLIQWINMQSTFLKITNTNAIKTNLYM